MRRLDLEKLLKVVRSRVDQAFQETKTAFGEDSVTLTIVATELEDLFKGGCDVAEKFFKGSIKADWLPYMIDETGRVRRLHLPVYGGREP